MVKLLEPLLIEVADQEKLSVKKSVCDFVSFILQVQKIETGIAFFRDNLAEAFVQ